MGRVRVCVCAERTPRYQSIDISVRCVYNT